MPNKKGTTLNSKGYPRITAGPLRDRYVHRIVAEALLGRDLRRDEEVHHKDKNRKNPKWNNLIVLGEKDYGWVSAKQAWYMRELDIKTKKYWDEFMAEEEKRFDNNIQEAKASGNPYEYEDGHIEERWEDHLSKMQSPETSIESL